MNKISLNYIIIISVILSLLTAHNSMAQTIESGNTTILRLDKILFQYTEKPSSLLTKSLADNYPVITTALAQTINSNSNQDNALETLRKYYSHPQLKSIYKEVLDKFSNIDQFEKELTEVKKIAKLELSATNSPQFMVHVSGFKENTIYINNILSLSIDKYMGANYKAYKGYFRPYQLQQMEPRMIVRDFTKAWLMADYIKTESTNGDLLAELIEHGKLLYTLSILLPHYSQADIVGYTDMEYDWCINNYRKTWSNLIKQNHLFTNDRHIIHGYFDDAPNNRGLINGAPTKFGTWLGFQIVKQYAMENKKTLKSVLSTDSRIILKDSKFK